MNPIGYALDYHMLISFCFYMLWWEGVQQANIFYFKQHIKQSIRKYSKFFVCLFSVEFIYWMKQFSFYGRWSFIKTIFLHLFNFLLLVCFIKVPLGFTKHAIIIVFINILFSHTNTFHLEFLLGGPCENSTISEISSHFFLLVPDYTLIRKHSFLCCFNHNINLYRELDSHIFYEGCQILNKTHRTFLIVLNHNIIIIEINRNSNCSLYKIRNSKICQLSCSNQSFNLFCLIWVNKLLLILFYFQAARICGVFSNRERLPWVWALVLQSNISSKYIRNIKIQIVIHSFN
jgi:hypothetical protein